MLTVRNGIEGDDIDTEVIKDVIGNYSFGSDDMYTSSNITKDGDGINTMVYPTGFFLDGTNAISPIDIDNNQFMYYDDSTGRVVIRGALLTNASSSPRITGDYYDINDSLIQGSGMTFNFWNPTILDYSPVTLRLAKRNDVTATYIAPANDSYPQIIGSCPDCFICAGIEHAPTYAPYSIIQYSDLQYTGANITWPFASLDQNCTAYLRSGSNSNPYIAQGNIATNDISKAIHYTGKFCLSPFANYIATGQYGNNIATTYSDVGKVYPVITDIYKNFDDPQYRWCGRLTLYIMGKPAGQTYQGCAIYSVNTLANLYRSIRATTGANSLRVEYAGVPNIQIPDSYGPFGNWTVLLDDTFTSDISYPINPYEIDEEINVIFDDP